MAKSVTEEDLAAGMKSLGGFGALSSRRDSPFRDSRADVKPPEPKAIEVKPSTEPRTVYQAPVVEVKPPVEAKPVPVEVPKPVAVKPAYAQQVREPLRPKQKAPQRKADIFSERVTLQVSAEMRDEVDELARQLQRAKSSKDERITANTVMRVAIRSFLDEFKLKGGEVPNSEEEFLKIAKRGKKAE